MNKIASTVALALLLLGGKTHAGFMIYDNTFANSDWSLNVIQTVPGSVTATQVIIGNEYARQNTFDVLADGGYVDALNTYTAASYTPSSQGAILNVYFSEYFVGGDPFIVPLVVQNGIFYYGPGASAYDVDQGAYDANLTQNVYYSSSFTNPNFSASGSQIFFGYAMDAFVQGSGADDAEDFLIRLDGGRRSRATRFGLVGNRLGLPYDRHPAPFAERQNHRLIIKGASRVHGLPPVSAFYSENLHVLDLAVLAETELLTEKLDDRFRLFNDRDRPALGIHQAQLAYERGHC